MQNQPFITRFIPSLHWLRHYQKAWLSADVVAGLTASAVIIPKAMAYATIAGLPLQAGLYTALIPMIVYAFLGTSRPLSVSTTTTIAILMATQLSSLGTNMDADSLLSVSATLAVMVGVILAAASIFRLGFVANFISEPVLIGFKSGIGLVIVIDQLPKLLGFHIPHGGFLQNIRSLIEHLPDTSTPTLLLTCSMLAMIFCFEKFLPKAPTPLIVVACAIAASYGLGLSELGVSTVGFIPNELPSLMLPQLSWVESMWPAAVGIALMSFTETIAAGRAFVAHGETRPEPNQELLALGAANMVGGFFGAMPAGGGTTQTAVNRLAGARTQVSELVTALVTLVVLLLLSPLIALMPQAALAAVVVAYSLELIKPSDFFEIKRVRRGEFYWALVALAGVVLLGTLKGILVAVIVSLLGLAQQAFNPPVYVIGRKKGSTIFRPLSPNNPDDETFPGLLLVRLEGRMFFANAQRVGDKIWPLITEYNPRVVALDCSSIIDIEYTALKMLAEAEERLREKGIMLWLVAMNVQVYLMVKGSPLGEVLGEERMILNRQTAVEKYLSMYP
jgi:high affinity sulfate transporter 1